METEPRQTLHQAVPTARSAQPRDLTWSGLPNDQELLCRAREIAEQNQHDLALEKRTPCPKEIQEPEVTK